MILVIGNKRYSSWSMRPWVAMKHFEIPFEERLVKLDLPTTTQQILHWSPSGKVPALIDSSTRVWDSLAICEYLNDKFPGKAMWPQSPRARAWARSVACEMHSGFAAMRHLMSHDVQKRIPGFDGSSVESDVLRVKAIWDECLTANAGHGDEGFLFGKFSIADAMYAPVVNRFVTYDVKLEGRLAEYSERMLSVPAIQEWNAGGRAEQ